MHGAREGANPLHSDCGMKAQQPFIPIMDSVTYFTNSCCIWTLIWMLQDNVPVLDVNDLEGARVLLTVRDRADAANVVSAADHHLPGPYP